MHSIGSIAKALGHRRAQVKYVLDSRESIKPIATIAGTRVYDNKAIAQVRAELKLVRPYSFSK